MAAHPWATAQAGRNPPRLCAIIRRGGPPCPSRHSSFSGWHGYTSVATFIRVFRRPRSPTDKLVSLAYPCHPRINHGRQSAITKLSFRVERRISDSGWSQILRLRLRMTSSWEAADNPTNPPDKRKRVAQPPPAVPHLNRRSGFPAAMEWRPMRLAPGKALPRISEEIPVASVMLTKIEIGPAGEDRASTADTFFPPNLSNRFVPGAEGPRAERLPQGSRGRVPWQGGKGGQRPPLDC
jgi:hypothetical protein